MTDRLEQLLREADAARDIPRHAGDSERAAAAAAAAVVRLHGKRRARRRAAAVAAGAACVLGVLLLTDVMSQRDRRGAQPEVATVTAPVNRPDSATLRAELSNLRAEAEARMVIVRAIEAWERDASAPGNREVAEADPLDEIDPTIRLDIERERAAMALVLAGDLVRARVPDPRPAAEAYALAAAQFPTTRAAAAARERLAELQ